MPMSYLSSVVEPKQEPVRRVGTAGLEQNEARVAGTVVREESSDFRRTYERLTELVRTRALAEDPNTPVHFQDSSLAEASCLGVSRASLVSIPTDSDFVVNCYMILLDRVPQAAEIAGSVALIRNKRMSRKLFIERLMTSEEYLVKGVRVVLR
jgi:hypothetical protein